MLFSMLLAIEHPAARPTVADRLLQDLQLQDALHTLEHPALEHPAHHAADRLEWVRMPCIVGDP